MGPELELTKKCAIEWNRLDGVERDPHPTLQPCMTLALNSDVYGISSSYPLCLDRAQTPPVFVVVHTHVVFGYQVFVDYIPSSAASLLSPHDAPSEERIVELLR